MKKGLPLLILSLIQMNCLGTTAPNTLNEMGSAVLKNQPYVEGYIEYLGPGGKWAGPVPLMIHITTKSDSKAVITAIPSLWKKIPPVETVPARMPASVVEAQEIGVTSQMAREKLSHLATALQGPERPYSGCLYPIRVRLIGLDGAVLTKQGCRGYSSWAPDTSEVASFFLGKI